MWLNLWSQLPVHLIEYVLRKLPLKSLVELRLVSKQWNLFIVSSAVDNSSPCPSSKNVLLSVAADGTSVTSYNKERKEWHNISLSFPGFNPSDFKLVASNDGLLCFQNVNDSGELLICNPLTKRWKQLPNIAVGHEPSAGCRIWDVAGLLTEKSVGSYFVIVVGWSKGDSPSEQSASNEVTRIYHSKKSSWTKDVVPSINAERTSMSVPRGKVPFNGSMYVLAFQKNYLGEEKWFLRKYDVQQRSWSLIAAPPGISHPDIFENDGQLYLAAQCCDTILGPELYIWKLDKAEKMWSQGKSIFRDLSVVFTRMPDHYADADTDCVAVCIGRRTSLFVVGLHCSGDVTVWTYDIATEKWECLPRVEPRRFVPQVVCMFQPSFTATV